MGKEDKEDSGFGFKDKAKAEETLKLLEQHDPNYRRLTVRGLLGRAKRVLSLTKAEEKIKNIKEAMEVFENWLADLDKNKEKKAEKTESSKKEKEKQKEKDTNGDKSSSSSSDGDVEMEDKPKEKELPSESVPGLGFKDPDAAQGTLKELEGRDPDYQKLAVKGLIGRAKRVLTCTRDEAKLSNIKAAVAIFDKFLDDFDTLHLSKQNNPYLSLGFVTTALHMAGDDVTQLQRSFVSAYTDVRGEYKRLRTVKCEQDSNTWDIMRNTHLTQLKQKYADTKLFDDDGKPTSEHLQMIVWAYSPEPARVKKSISETKPETKEEHSQEKKHEEEKKEQEKKKEEKKEEEGSRKRKSSGDNSESSSKKHKE